MLSSIIRDGFDKINTKMPNRNLLLNSNLFFSQPTEFVNFFAIIKDENALINQIY